MTLLIITSILCGVFGIAAIIWLVWVQVKELRRKEYLKKMVETDRILEETLKNRSKWEEIRRGNP